LNYQNLRKNNIVFNKKNCKGDSIERALLITTKMEFHLVGTSTSGFKNYIAGSGWLQIVLKRSIFFEETRIVFIALRMGVIKSANSLNAA
jgi:hypothetical protein